MYLRIFIVRVMMPVTLRAKSKMCHVAVCDSDSQITSNKSTSYVGVTNWRVNDKTPNLGHFTGNSGVKEIPSVPSHQMCLKLQNSFFGDYFSKFYVRRLICTAYKIMKNMADVIRC
jgi:hypothetical protein